MTIVRSPPTIAKPKHGYVSGSRVAEALCLCGAGHGGHGGLGGLGDFDFSFFSVIL